MGSWWVVPAFLRRCVGGTRGVRQEGSWRGVSWWAGAALTKGPSSTSSAPRKWGWGTELIVRAVGSPLGGVYWVRNNEQFATTENPASMGLFSLTLGDRRGTVPS